MSLESSMNFGIISSPVKLSMGVLERDNLSYATNMKDVDTDNYVYFIVNAENPIRKGDLYLTNKLTIVREASDNEKGAIR